MQNISFKSDEIEIHGVLALPESAQPVPGVVLFHGMTSTAGSYAPLAEQLAQKGIAGLAISMRGHGESGGDFNKATVGEAVNDALAAFDFLASQPGVDPNRIGLLGSSVGAILASLATQKRAAKSLVLRAPAAYTTEMMNITMAQTMENEGRQFHEIDNLLDTPAGQAIAGYSGALLIIASERDNIIPPAITTGYLQIAGRSLKKELKTLNGAPHNLSGTAWKDECNQIACDWFVATL